MSNQNNAAEEKALVPTTEEPIQEEQKPTVPQKSELDTVEYLKKLSSDTLQLNTAIRAGGEDVEELQYDFNKLTGWEVAEAIDSDKKATTIFRLTAKQALNLFAVAAAKATTAAQKALNQDAKGIDANDIKERIGAVDSVAAVQLAIVFFNMSTSNRSRVTTKK